MKQVKYYFAAKGSEPTEQDLGEATGFMEFSGDWQDCYVQEGKVIPMPKAPSENHLFDYKTKTFYQPTQPLQLTRWILTLLQKCG